MREQTGGSWSLGKCRACLGLRCLSGNHRLELIEKALALGHGIAVLGAGEITQELFLFVGEFSRDFDQHLDELVSDPPNFMEMIHQYCVAPLRRIYAEVYRNKRR